MFYLSNAPKVKRAKRIKKLVENGWTNREIGKLFKISEQRIGYIINHSTLLPNERRKYCVRCSDLIRGEYKRIVKGFLCQGCVLMWLEGHPMIRMIKKQGRTMEYQKV